MSTTDPGVEDTIKQTADDVDPNDAQRDLDQEEREDFAVPSRWWFAAVGCPLLAGTLGPIATMFNIMALVTSWRQTVPPHSTEHYGHKIGIIGWVDAVNAVSLVSAVVGNGALLLNMAKRVKFAIAQPLTIAGFLLAGCLLIADIAALGSSPHYYIKNPEIRPDSRHALTQAFYYAIFAAVLYMFIGFLMCFTVYGALRGQYAKQFYLTLSQRSLMLQTMSFVTYLLLGGLVYTNIEPSWGYLDSVYWADVTILTVGLGDYAPTTQVGRGLLFPFAIGGVLILGLVIGSIRSLVLERGRQKMSARMLEKRRATAVHNVDAKKQVVKISFFSSAPFKVDPNMSNAEKREQEFNVMRKVQTAAESERRYFALFNSSLVAIGLWFIGALIFTQTEYEQNWTYFQALYFSYTSLLTIGYGDFTPQSNSGKAFFVFWSLLAVPSLTILISNMGDTIVKWVSDLTEWVSRFTVLPGEGGFRASIKEGASDIIRWVRTLFGNFTGPGVFGISSVPDEKKGEGSSEYENKMLDRLAERLDTYTDDNDHDEQDDEHKQEKDIQFFHYVLARECRNLQKHLGASPPKQYSWVDWEYYLKLMGDEHDPKDFPGQEQPDIMVPEPMIAPDGLRGQDLGSLSSDTDGTNEKESQPSQDLGKVDGNVDRQQSVKEGLEEKRKNKQKSEQSRTKKSNTLLSNLEDWSWLSNESPLLSNKSETEWILERLSAALERELNRQRKGYRTKPPITRSDARRKGSSNGSAQNQAKLEQQRNLEKADKGEK